MAQLSQASPTRKVAAEEEKDRAEAIENLVNEAYLDWPNEAGVSPPFWGTYAVYDADQPRTSSTTSLSTAGPSSSPSRASFPRGQQALYFATAQEDARLKTQSRATTKTATRNPSSSPTGSTVSLTFTDSTLWLLTAIKSRSCTLPDAKPTTMCDLSRKRARLVAPSRLAKGLIRALASSARP